MQVFVNGKSILLEQQHTVSKLLLKVNVLSPTGIAVAVNNVVVVKAEWENCTLNENDKITLIRATQGG